LKQKITELGPWLKRVGADLILTAVAIPIFYFFYYLFLFVIETRQTRADVLSLKVDISETKIQLRSDIGEIKQDVRDIHNYLIKE